MRTELGRNYLDHCRRLLEEAEAGDALAEEALRSPRGRLTAADLENVIKSETCTRRS